MNSYPSSPEHHLRKWGNEDESLWKELVIKACAVAAIRKYPEIDVPMKRHSGEFPWWGEIWSAIGPVFQSYEIMNEAQKLIALVYSKPVILAYAQCIGPCSKGRIWHLFREEVLHDTYKYYKEQDNLDHSFNGFIDEYADNYRDFWTNSCAFTDYCPRCFSSEIADDGTMV